MPREPQKTPFMVIREVSLYAPGTEPTAAQREAAEALIERAKRAAREKDWESFETAQAAGFRLLANDRRHYVNEEYVLDDVILDPERPEFLMYYDTPDGKFPRRRRQSSPIDRPARPDVAAGSWQSRPDRA